MSVTEVKQALGNWSLTLRPDTPRELLDQIAPFGHVAIAPGRLDPAQIGDNLLAAARYVGVYRGRSTPSDSVTLNGAGMAFWLGDEDGKGDAIITATTAASATFANAVRQVLPAGGSVVEGTLTAVPGGGTFSNVWQYITPRDAIQYLTDTYSTASQPVSWRVNGNATLDAGPDTALFVTAPTAILVAKGQSSRDMTLSALKGQLQQDTDVEDYTTQVVLLAEGEGASTVTASASLVTPYRDQRGNLVVMRRIVSESDTDPTNAQARAQLQLNRFTSPRTAVQLSTDEYDVKGTFGVGDTIMVFDPDTGFVDANREVFWRGRPINPVYMPVTELTWPVPDGWTVGFRTQAGVWLDLSSYYVGESGATSVVVGGVSRALANGDTEPIGDRPIADASVPATPVFGASSTGSYQSSGGSGETKAQIQLTWATPLNSNGSTITDGDHYEIRYRASASGITTSWETTFVGWGTNLVLITGLIPGTNYDFQILAADAAIPPNRSAWSGSTTILSSTDAIAPSTPAAPTVAASSLAIQVTHTLGKSSGGTYNLEVDLDHFQVHGASASSFTPTSATMLGKLMANVGNIRGSIPAVGTFNTDQVLPTWIKVLAVDQSGNVSGASTAASATALLINDAHISDLTVSKVSAGTMTASWVVGGTIATALSGARVQLVGSGLNAFNAGASATVQISGADGSAVITGRFRTGFPGSGVPYMDMINSGDRTTIYMYQPNGADYAFINSPTDAASTARLGVNTSAFLYTASNLSSRHRLFLNNGSGIQLETVRVSTGLATIGTALSLGPSIATINTFTAASGVNTGGQIYLASDQAGSYYVTATVNDGGYAVSYSDGARIGAYNAAAKRCEFYMNRDQTIWVTGKWSSNNTVSGTSGLYTGTWNITGANSYSISYGVTMNTTVFMLFSLFRNALTAYDMHGLVQSATGASFYTTSTTTFDLNYWGIRIG